MNTNKIIEITNKLTQTLEIMINSKDLDINRLTLLISNSMELVEKYPELSGIEKKKIVLDVLKQIIINKVKNEDQKITLLQFLDEIIPDMIDLIIDATKGKLDINNVSHIAVGCFGRCIGK